MVNIEPTGAISPIKKPIRIDISNNKRRNKQPSSRHSGDDKEQQTRHPDENEVQHIDEIV